MELKKKLGKSDFVQDFVKRMCVRLGTYMSGDWQIFLYHCYHNYSCMMINDNSFRNIIVFVQ